MPPIRAPFGRMTPRAWQNLAIAALIFIYGLQFSLDLAWGNLFGNVGVDFASFWTAGRIANEYGYPSVYDLGLVADIQGPLLPARAEGLAEIRPLPAAILPVFVVPFQVLALLPPATAALTWIVLTLAGTILYIMIRARPLIGRALDAHEIFLIIVAVPVFLNAFLGQVNLWLMICVGEFLRAAFARRPVLAGVWMAGLLLKPQLLVLIPAAFIFQRWWRTILGMLAAAVAILLGSWLLAGTEALRDLVRLWIGFAGGLPSNDPQLMMNWRMLGLHLDGVAGDGIAAAIMWVGMGTTVVAALWPWLRRLDHDYRQTSVAFLGLLAGTALTAWHAHVHMAMILIPALILVFWRQRVDAPRVLNFWIFVPAAMFVVRLLLGALSRLIGPLPGLYGFLDLLGGIGLFAVNLLLLVWAIRVLQPWRTARV